MTENFHCIGNSLNLLDQFEQILAADPLIDEIGFIHPSQFSMLSKEAEDSERSGVDHMNFSDTSFWVRDHKLGISTQVILSLLKEARNAFMAAVKEYTKLSHQPHESVMDSPCMLLSSADSIESEAMKHSKALLLLSCNFGTAWNFRKLVLSKRQHFHMYEDELCLSALVLSYSPKSEQAWSHRRWVIKLVAQKFSTLQELIERESELVERTAERSKMNYRAWNHRCWLVSYMTKEQVLHEFKKTRKWAELHVADNCCFHYRRLLLKLLEDSVSEHSFAPRLRSLFKEELDWNKALIKLYVGREALWLHRRFLSSCWLKQFNSNLTRVSSNYDHDEGIEDGFLSFTNHEVDLVNSCLIIVDNDFDDFQAQAIHAATYLLWLKKHSPAFEIEAERKAFGLRNLLQNLCPERCSLWDNLLDSRSL